jgi:hypothetical protein
MDLFNDRRTQLALLGGALALVAGLALAFALVHKGEGEKTAPPPASTGGLVVQAGAPDDGRLDAARPLRCFVAGQFVGELALAACAQRNGVATGALDVGTDEGGNLAAADQAGTVLTPLPPVAESVPVVTPPATIAPAGACWRYSGAEWRQLPGDQTLNACVQALFAGRCERPGGATYGRWMQQALRLVAGKIEVSGDNRSFHTLVDQGANCSIPPVG